MAARSIDKRMKKGLWVTKDNRLIAMEAVMNPVGYKIMTYFMAMAAREERLTGLTANAKEVLRISHIGMKSMTQLKKATSAAVKTIFHIEDPGGEDGWSDIPLLTELKYKDGELYCDFNEKKLRQYLMGKLPSFTRYEYEQAALCSSYYAIRLYEICRSWVRTGMVMHDVDKWRNLLGASTKTYARFSNFSQRVMTPAVNEVNEKTDIRIVREDIKEGRSVTHIKMHITQAAAPIPAAEQIEPPILLPPEPVSPVQTEEKPTPQKRKTKVRMKIESLPEPQRSCALRLVDVYKLSATKALEFVKMDGGVLYCQEQMEYVRKAKMAGQVKNLGGYMRRALEDDYAGKEKIQVQAKAAEAADKADKALWNKQAQKITQDLSDKAGNGMRAEDDEHTIWEKKFAALRSELMGLLVERKIDFADMKEGMDAWKKANPEPQQAIMGNV